MYILGPNVSEQPHIKSSFSKFLTLITSQKTLTFTIYSSMGEVSCNIKNGHIDTISDILNYMRKGTDWLTLCAKIAMDCRNFRHAALNSSFIHFLKLNYYGTLTYIAQQIHSTAQLNLNKGIFNHKTSIIVEF